MPRPVLHADGGEQFRATALNFWRGQILQQAGQAHVFLDRERGQQVEELKDEADLGAAQAGQASFVELVNRFVIEVNSPLVRTSSPPRT